MYCKKCNVRLKEYLKECPLCHTKVENKNDETNPYNPYVENFSTRVNIKYFSKIIIEFLILVSLITLIVNICVNKTVNWSLYAISSSFYISSFYTYIIFVDKKNAFMVNMFSLELLLLIISYLTHGLNWFLFIVGPIILIIIYFVLLNIYLSKYNNILRNFSILLTYIALVLFLLNGFIKVYKTNTFYISWSIYSNIPILIISFILFGLSFNKRIQNEFEKRFFI